MKFWFKILLFFTLIVVLDRVVGNLIQKYALEYHFDNRIELLLENKLDRDVLVIGSSRALNGIDPETIQNNTGLSCFNLAYSGSNVQFQETILDLILAQENKPKYIIYNLDDPGTLVDYGGLVVYRKEELFPYVHYEAINKIICDRLNKSYFATRFSKTFLQNVNFTNALKYLIQGKEKPSYQINNINSNGANLMEGHQPGFENMVFNKEILKYSEEKEYMPYLNSFKRILKKSKQSGVELILVISPSYFSKNIGFKERIKEIAGDNFILLDYSNEFDDSELFYNYGHLNKSGAIKFSEILSKDLNDIQ